MSSAIRFRIRFEVDEYFAIDDASDERHEYADGLILGRRLLYGPALDPASTKAFRSIPNRTFIAELPADTSPQAQPELVLYREAPGLRDYLLISQQAANITTWTSDVDGGFTRRDFDHLDSIVPIASLAIVLPAREIYEADRLFMQAVRA